jgi:hypothetical protein
MGIKEVMIFPKLYSPKPAASSLYRHADAAVGRMLLLMLLALALTSQQRLNT